MATFISKLLQIMRPSLSTKGLVRAEAFRQHTDHAKMMLGRLLVNSHRNNPPNLLTEAEFQVFSQFGDDGIIQYLVDKLKPIPHTFIEFGVGDYSEANTKFLLLNNNWSGLIMDGSEEFMNRVRKQDFYWRHDLTAKAAFINADNVNDLIAEHFRGDVGVLHIDIDGNDYWVWKALTCINPVIAIIEYNSVFGIEKAITIPYDPNFNRTTAHFSHLYFGSSLLALCELAKEKGYVFIGTNSHGNNAYFIRKDKLGNILPVTPLAGYTESKFRESRDEMGNLTFLSGHERFNLIKNMPVINVRTNKTEKL